VQPTLELGGTHEVVTLVIAPDDIKAEGTSVDFVHSLLRECKLYGVVFGIAAAVWCASYSAYVDERFYRTQWLAGPDEQPKAFAETDMDEDEVAGLDP
jgi:hypothetical protein